MIIHYSYSKEALSNKDILIHHHLGLGDHLVLNGLVNYISENHSQDKKIYLLCKSRNYQNVTKLYKNKSNIFIVVSSGEENLDALSFLMKNPGVEYFRIGHEKYSERIETKNNWDCGQVFYYLANIPYENRFSKFYIDIDQEKNDQVLENLNPNKEDFIFLHDDPTRGYYISIENRLGLKVIKNDDKFGIFDYIKLLRSAKEIHLMPSSFYCLIESVEGIKADLYRYNIRNVNFGNITKYKWNNI